VQGGGALSILDDLMGKKTQPEQVLEALARLHEDMVRLERAILYNPAVLEAASRVSQKRQYETFLRWQAQENAKDSLRILGPPGQDGPVGAFGEAGPLATTPVPKPSPTP